MTGGSQRQFANHVLRRTPPCHSDGRVSALACLTPSGRCSPISPCLREACCGAPRGTRSFHYFISGSCVCCSSLLPVIFFCGFISFFFSFSLLFLFPPLYSSILLLFLFLFLLLHPPPSSSSSLQVLDAQQELLQYEGH